ncbi:MAG: lysophospholipid acyltransferase family protein [Pseudomonadota bacterium]
MVRSTPGMIAHGRAIFALVLCAVVVLVLAPVQLIILAVARHHYHFLPRLFHRIALFLMGVKVTCHGKRSSHHPLLIVANHVSWLDILVLGSVASVAFIAKADMKSWPILGWLARLQRSIFVEREERRKAGKQADEIADRMNEGDVIVLFAEGTTGDGNTVLEFKSALFGAAQSALRNSDHEMVSIQPVAITYTRLQGMAMGRFWRPVAAWPGDITIGGHLYNVILEGAIDVEVCFGPAVDFTRSQNRKTVASKVHKSVRDLAAHSLRGRNED